jgi:hypothetical protein
LHPAFCAPHNMLSHTRVLKTLPISFLYTNLILAKFSTWRTHRQRQKTKHRHTHTHKRVPESFELLDLALRLQQFCLQLRHLLILFLHDQKCVFYLLWLFGVKTDVSERVWNASIYICNRQCGAGDLQGYGQNSNHVRVSLPLWSASLCPWAGWRAAVWGLYAQINSNAPTHIEPAPW